MTLPESISRLDDRDFLARLRCVSVHQRVVLIRQAGDGFEQLARAGNGEPRRERGVQAAVRRAVPARADRDRFTQPVLYDDDTESIGSVVPSAV